MSVDRLGVRARRLLAAVVVPVVLVCACAEPAQAEPQVECHLPSGQIVALGRLQCREQFGLVLGTLDATSPAPSASAAGRAAVGQGTYKVLGSGSGFFVTADGTVLTNAHVVSPCDAVRVMQAGGEPMPARVSVADAKVDLALLKTQLRPPVVAEIRASPDAVAGEDVVVVGYPGEGLRDFPSLGTGIVTWVPAMSGGVVSLTFAGRAEGGMSGGPLLDRDGRVAGVVFAGMSLRGVKAPRDHGLAIQAPVLRDFLARQGVRFTSGASTRDRRPEAVSELAEALAVRVFCLVEQ